MVAPTTAPSSSTGSTTSADAAAAAARQREAEAARRRAEAAAAAKRAEDARKAAEAAQAKSAAAQRDAVAQAAAAKAAREKASAAQTGVANQRRLYAHESPQMSPESAAEWKKSIDADQKDALALSTRAGRLEDQAKTARTIALREGNAALAAERTANTRATEAGQPKPFAGADRVTDVVDAGSLSRADQAKLLGAVSPVTADEAAAADARRIAEATGRSPLEGARALELAMKEGGSPEYRKSLAEQSESSVTTIGKQVNEGALSDADRDAAVAALANAGHLSGRDGGQSIADAFTATWPAGAANEGTVRSLAAASKTPGGAQLGADVAEALTARGDYAAAEAISQASPELTAKTTIDAGEDAARDSVDVDGDATAHERAAIEGDIGRVDQATRTKADELFTRAGSTNLPRGVTGTVDGDRAEIVTRDRSGNVTSREYAVRDGEDVTYSRVDYKGGNATRQDYAARGEQATVTTADWKEAPSANPSNPSWDELAARAEGGEKGIALRQLDYQDTGDELETREKVVNEEGRNEVFKTYKTQTGGDGIIGSLENQLDLDQTIDVTETQSTSKLWGQDEEKVNEWTYEQGDRRISAVDGEGDDTPKQWKLEKQDGNVYRAQTFFEGAEDFTTVTERRAEGRTVTETSETRGKDEDGNSYETSSGGTTTFAADGTIAEQFNEEVDAEGVRTSRDYERTVSDDGRIHEQIDARITAADGTVSSASKSIDSKRLPDGTEKVTGISSTVTDTHGTAVSTYTEKGGHQLTVNGTPVPLAEGSPQLEGLTEGEKDLAGNATVDVLTTIKKVADQGKNVIDLTKLAGVGMSSTLPTGTSVADRLNLKLDANRARLEARFGTTRVVDTSEALLRGASGAKVGVGGLAALASGASLIDNIQNHNFVKAGIDAGNVAVGGANVVVGARELSALRATPNGALALDDLGNVAGRLGQFAKYGGLAVGVAAGGYQVVDGIIKGDGVSVAQGGVGIAGTVGAFAAGGAVGGPAGVLVGVGIGLATLGVQWGIGKIWGGDDEPKMAAVEI